VIRRVSLEGYKPSIVKTVPHAGKKRSFSKKLADLPPLDQRRQGFPQDLYTIKPSSDYSPKARFCSPGEQQPVTHTRETFAPTPSAESFFKILCALKLSQEQRESS
jgi:hypothetical protein